MEFRRVLFRSSLAPAIGTMPAATAAAEPLLEPPGVCAGFQGLRHGPQASGSVMPLAPNSGVLVRPNTNTPARSQPSLISACSVGATCSSFRARLPYSQFGLAPCSERECL